MIINFHVKSSSLTYWVSPLSKWHGQSKRKHKNSVFLREDSICKTYARGGGRVLWVGLGHFDHLLPDETASSNQSHVIILHSSVNRRLYYVIGELTRRIRILLYPDLELTQPHASSHKQPTIQEKAPKIPLQRLVNLINTGRTLY